MLRDAAPTGQEATGAVPVTGLVRQIGNAPDVRSLAPGPDQDRHPTLPIRGHAAGVSALS
ncbi:hypothetical protein GCM10010844_36220 [Deinococcus radiotolerans]|uniref:Uncharacterized protein n=1 Tax=Deinococcus radiotolerans TaxID=1309407 RepID=A0ABQ2FPJ2_9DEIO|nr:hypothetical protein GCM10010844_36220 [Deinococcus radiotolerans]